jgi:hypothetical protein
VIELNERGYNEARKVSDPIPIPKIGRHKTQPDNLEK